MWVVEDPRPVSGRRGCKESTTETYLVVSGPEARFKPSHRLQATAPGTPSPCGSTYAYRVLTVS